MLFLYFLVYVHICIVCYPCGVTIKDDDDDEYSRPMKQTGRQTDRQTERQTHSAAWESDFLLRFHHFSAVASVR